jgi:hypothetical protein
MAVAWSLGALSNTAQAQQTYQHTNHQQRPVYMQAPAGFCMCVQRKETQYVPGDPMPKVVTVQVGSAVMTYLGVVGGQHQWEGTVHGLPANMTLDVVIIQTNQDGSSCVAQSYAIQTGPP